MPMENTPPIELWRWKMIRKVADYINQPDDINMSELKALIERYRVYHDLQEFIPNRTTKKTG